jgi:uncharacterized membrane protein
MRPPETYLAPVVLLAFAGAGISAFLLANHYGAVEAGFCTIAPGSDCDKVNRSAWSEIAGVPVAAIGLGGFVALAGIALDIRLRDRPFFRARDAFLLSLGGLAFGVYLTWVELAVLREVCLLCVTSFALGLAIVGLTGLAYRSEVAAGSGTLEAGAP